MRAASIDADLTLTSAAAGVRVLGSGDQLRIELSPRGGGLALVRLWWRLRRSGVVAAVDRGLDRLSVGASVHFGGRTIVRLGAGAPRGLAYRLVVAPSA